MPDMLAKELVKCFGFSYHTAPGEAEAECALLQRKGIVDAVLSEDVDTLMFGCGQTIRNWSSENSKGNGPPTHVDIYNAEATKNGRAGLDREGMILIALMSGGDYITEGIPGCGIKVACEAARAGYGKSLCSLARPDSARLAAWREDLAHEIQTNESKHFRVKHKSLKIPENFPNPEVLGYYTHPVVSNEARIQSLKQEIQWDADVDVQKLKQFVGDAFEWKYKGGAKQLIRGLAPAMLISKLLKRSTQEARTNRDLVAMEAGEMELIRAICGKRTHFSTDGMPELRVIYTPIDIVGIDLDAEEEDSEYYSRSGLATNNEDEDGERGSDEDLTSRAQSTSPAKRRAAPYDPAQPEKLWIPETMVKLGVPLMAENYEESLINPKKLVKQKFAVKRAATKEAMPRGALDKYVTISKPAVNTQVGCPTQPSNARGVTKSQPALPSAYIPSALERPASSQPVKPPTRPEQTNTSRARAKSPKPSPANIKARRVNSTSKTSKAIAKAKSPWDIAKGQSESSPSTSVSVSKAGLNASGKAFRQPVYSDFDDSDGSAILEPISRTRRKHTRSITPPFLSDSTGAYNNLESLSSNLRPLSSHSTDGNSPLKRRTPNAGSSSNSFSVEDHPLPDAMRLPGSRDTNSPEFCTSSLSNVTQRSRRSSPAKKVIPSVIDLSSSPIAPKQPPEIMAPLSTISPPHRETSKDLKKSKKLFMLRESLDGAWREVDESQVGPNSRAWSDIEVVDLTYDD